MARDNNKKLLVKYQGTTDDSESCKLTERDERKLPGLEIQPDSFKSYMVCLAGTFCNVVLMGYCYSFGVLFPPLQGYFKEDKATTGECWQ